MTDESSKKRALVTGASGFLGGALTRALVARGHRVRALVRETSQLNHLQDLDIDIARGCLEDGESLTAALKDVRLVFHCAAVSTDWAPWSRFQGANVLGVENLLRAAVQAGTVERFVHISTTDVYGYPRTACDESGDLRDTGLPYNRSKIQGERIVWRYYREENLPVTVIRPVSIYGPRSKDFVAEIVRLLLKKEMVLIDEGRSHAGLLYIDNAVEGIIRAAEAVTTVGQAYNLRDEGDVTWAQYVQGLARGLNAPPVKTSLPAGLALTAAWLVEKAYGMLLIGKRPLLTRHAVYLFCRDQGYAIDKARRDFGYAPAVRFEQGLQQTLAWFDSEEGRQLVPGVR